MYVKQKLINWTWWRS